MMLNSQIKKNIQKAMYKPGKFISNPARLLLKVFEQSNRFALDNIISGLTSIGKEAVPAHLNQKSIQTFLLKPVGDVCNLKCRYCYETERLEMLSKSVMRLDTLKSILNNILENVNAGSMIYFHGGEPLLAGLDFFKEAIRLIKAHPNGKMIRLGVQTNGTLINDEWCRFFADNQLGVGLSIDGYKATNDMHRVFQNGKGSFEKVMHGIECLKKNEITFGVISVITKYNAIEENAPDELFNFFLSNNINDFDVHPACTPSKHANYFNVSPILYSRFMTKLFDIWLNHGDAQIRIRSFKDFFESLSGIMTNTCYRSGSCQRIIGVDPSGMTSPCTRPFDNEFNFGNLSEKSLSEIMSEKPFKNFLKNEKRGQSITGNCKWSYFCGNGGCPHERYLNDNQNIAGKHVYCTCHTDEVGGYPEIFKHIYNRIEQVFETCQLQNNVNYSNPNLC